MTPIVISIVAVLVALWVACRFDGWERRFLGILLADWQEYLMWVVRVAFLIGICHIVVEGMHA